MAPVRTVLDLARHERPWFNQKTNLYIRRTSASGCEVTG